MPGIRWARILRATIASGQDGFDPRAAQTAQLEGGYSVLELPSYEAALEWAAKIAVSCRCAQEVRAFQDDPAS